MKRLLVIFCSVTLLFFAFLITRCGKEYSYEGGAPASFTLVGAPGECTEFKVNGSYFTAAATDLNNTVEVNVDVATAGNYSIATDVADGISFSASGNFTDTGFQTIVLKCAGTPGLAGTFTYTVPGDNGCHFSITVVNKPPADYVLSGSPNDCQSPTFNGNYIALQALTNSNTVTISISVISTGDYSISTDTIDGISFSAEGTFATTGDQQVILTGDGIPNAPGLFYFNLNAASSQCTFTLQVINAAPLATYVLQSGQAGSSLLCAPQSVQGTYVSGTPLNLTNTITITPYVTVPGNYTISTGTVNGVMFELSGTFTAIGAQDVILKGYGTPIASGTFAFVPQIIGPSPLGGASCEVDVTFQ